MKALLAITAGAALLGFTAGCASDDHHHHRDRNGDREHSRYQHYDGYAPEHPAGFGGPAPYQSDRDYDRAYGNRR